MGFISSINVLSAGLRHRASIEPCWRMKRSELHSQAPPEDLVRGGSRLLSYMHLNGLDALGANPPRQLCLQEALTCTFSHEPSFLSR